MRSEESCLYWINSLVSGNQWSSTDTHSAVGLRFGKGSCGSSQASPSVHWCWQPYAAGTSRDFLKSAEQVRIPHPPPCSDSPLFSPFPTHYCCFPHCSWGGRKLQSCSCWAACRLGSSGTATAAIGQGWAPLPCLILQEQVQGRGLGGHPPHPLLVPLFQLSPAPVLQLKLAQVALKAPLPRESSRLGGGGRRREGVMTEHGREGRGFSPVWGL